MYLHGQTGEYSFIAVYTVMILLLALLPGTLLAQSHADMDGIEGIHIMADGAVMLGTGEVLDDASVNANGDIILGSGETVSPAMDMRPEDMQEGDSETQTETAASSQDDEERDVTSEEEQQGISGWWLLIALLLGGILLYLIFGRSKK